jgi:uncharacterized membrane protein YedE/YeeE
MNDIDGDEIVIPTFYSGITKYLLGGIIFGLGWALTGSCPGPLYIQIGYGSTVMIIAVFSAFAGSMLYGTVKDKLPQ